ncbi:Asp-tRNA(Asn)/Glu-tRNA(Gln) amidotransferase subunit GatB [Candidatus Dependentiae bacterium]|nr:Asp-tRNA(Asn)/Glu-tRNA(Gln) amidotransferase subunit GatB [Candidatus Dependentiae bacterium]
MSDEIKNVLNKYPDFEANIGMEIHVQLKTKSKIFCSCPNQFGQKPNENICPICSGYPGVLPLLNKRVVDFAIMAGIATNCEITPVSRFSRKHYMYPDLPKNFQITQNEPPICKNGHIIIESENEKEKRIRLIRIHIEEDAGKNIHSTSEDKSYIDLNRAGTPLLEIVSHPDISNSYEAKLYLTRLKSIVEYLGISDANMEKGSFRGDVNISVKRKDEEKLGTKVELKNINSFKFIAQAIEYEIERQIKIIKEGGKINQETRSWDTKEHKSFIMRSKEEAADYRYLREPDLPLIIVDKKWIEKIKNEIPELPNKKIKRFKDEYNLSNYEAEILTGNIKLANYFEEVVKNCKLPKKASNWILRNLLGYLKENKIDLDQLKISAKNFADLILVIENKIINTKVAQEIFLIMAQTGKNPKEIIKEQGLEQLNDEEKLEKVVLEIINNNPEQVEKYLEGKNKLFGFFVGLAMKQTKGKANPKIINELLKKHLTK